MRKLEAVTKEIVDELGYLQRREMRMRDTNGQSICTATLVPCTWSACVVRLTRAESTNERVRNFSIMITVGIIALGVWQVSRPTSLLKELY